MISHRHRGYFHLGTNLSILFHTLVVNSRRGSHGLETAVANPTQNQACDALKNEHSTLSTRKPTQNTAAHKDKQTTKRHKALTAASLTLPSLIRSDVLQLYFDIYCTALPLMVKDHT